jgi:hypothetical protein
VQAKHAFVRDYIDWANGQLIQRLQRVEHGTLKHLAISFPVWKSAGLPVSKHHNPLGDFHLKADA